MQSKIKIIVLSFLLSIIVGLGIGIATAAFNGLITDFFTSPHYQTSQQSHRFIVGIAIGYGVVFALLTVTQIFINVDKQIRIIYPASGLISLLIAFWLRTLGGSLGNLDCGASCVDTIVPQEAQISATHLVMRVLILIYAAGVLLYIGKEKKYLKFQF